MALINCANCSAQISDKAKTCPKCGSEVILKEKVKCVECGTDIDKGLEICPNCGIEQQVKHRATPITENRVNQPAPRKFNTLLWSLIGGGIIIGILISVAVVTLNTQSSYNPSSDPYNNNSYIAPPPRPKTEAELKEELREKEISHPTDYIKVEYNWRVNLIGNTILEGSISNNATIAKFKNLRIRANFYSKTDVLLGQDEFTVMEFIKPGKSVSFRHKIVGWWEGATQSKYEILEVEPY